MIRKFLAREGRFLLQEFDAADWGTLWRRIAFYGTVWTLTTAVLLGLVFVGETYGLEWMWAAVVIILLLHLCRRRQPLYIEGAPFLLGSDNTALEPPAPRTLHPPSTPRIGEGKRPALPGRRE